MKAVRQIIFFLFLQGVFLNWVVNVNGEVNPLKQISREGKWAPDNRFVKKNYVEDFTSLINRFDNIAPGALLLPVEFVEQITPAEVIDCADPYFTGDGRGVVFQSIEMGVPEEAKPRVVTFLDIAEQHPYVIDWGRDPAISPDNRYICWYSSLGTTSLTIYVNEVRSKKTVAKFSNSREPSWSPDGQFLLFTSASGNSRLHYADVSDFKVKSLFSLEGRQPVLSYDKKLLAYQGEGAKIYIYDFDTGHKRRLTNFQGGHETDPSWSPDGKWVLYTHFVDLDSDGKYNLIEEPKQIYITSVNTRKSFAVGGIEDSGEAMWSPDGRHIVSKFTGPESVYSSLILITLPEQFSVRHEDTASSRTQAGDAAP